MSLRTLKQRIEELGGAGVSPVVPVDLFFDGNDDRGSIGCNLSPHPGLPTFASVLAGIRARPDVADVVVQIVDGMDDDEWPFSDRVFIITTASDEAVHAWAAALQPDELSPDRYLGWFGATTPPPGAPAIPDGYRVTYLFWD
jgi:hypothetical protein